MDDIKIDSQDAVKKVQELAEKWKKKKNSEVNSIFLINLLEAWYITTTSEHLLLQYFLALDKKKVFCLP